MINIRLVTVRGISYGFSLIVLAALYGFVTFGLADWLFDLQLSFSTQVGLSLATAVAGLSFRSLQKRFDTITNQLFFRDAYDPQTLFDDLNRLLVSSLDIDHLMRKSAQLIANNLRLEYCVISLGDSNDGHRLFGVNSRSISKKDVALLRAIAPKTHQTIIITNQLGPRHTELRNVLRRNNVAVLVRLSQNVRLSHEGLGYIMLGHKKSGSPYSELDTKTLQSIANELIIAIQNALHYEEVQNFNITLQAEVDEATRKLRRSNEKLKALDEAKNDFVSMASHQLRTPLTSIKGYTSMVLEGDAGRINATQRELLEQSYASAQRMVYLIADLLNVSRLKTGKFMIEQTSVNIAEVVAQEIGQLKETAAGRSLELTYTMPADFPSIMLDETKTRQVIMNFIDNAIYYTPAGGKIKVELRETPASVEFRVTDNGIGVPVAERQHLFTKFYRAGNARTARPDGTGLGLFMAKKVVVAQGGAIIFETEEGKGSTFGFIFAKQSPS